MPQTDMPRSIALQLLVAGGLAALACWCQAIEAQPEGKPDAPSGLGAEELVVSLNRASLEVIDGAGSGIALEVFQIVKGRAVRLEPPTDRPLWRNKGILWLNLDAPERPDLVYRLRAPKELALDLHANQGNVTITHHEGSVRVTTSLGNARLGFIAGAVDVQTSAGDVWLERGGPDVKIKTSGGKMFVGEIYGPATLTSSGGGIAVQEAHGKVTARSSGGPISIDRARHPVRAEAGGGGLTVNFTASPNGESILKAAGGPVRVGLPSQANCRIAARGDGEVDTELPVEWRDTRDGYRRGLLNAQGGTLTLQCVGGGIQLRGFEELTAAAEHSWPLPPTSVALPSVDANRLQPLLITDRTGAAGTAFPPKRPEKSEASLRVDRDEGIWEDSDWKQVTMLVPGLLLRSGRWVEGEVTALDEMRVSYRASGGSAQSARAGDVAAILFAPVPDTRQAILGQNAQGVLLRNGDFLEGELKALELGGVTLSSALFGLKKFTLGKDAVALVLHGRPSKQ